MKPSEAFVTFKKILVRLGSCQREVAIASSKISNATSTFSFDKMGSGESGVVAMDKFGNIGISFNSEGMYSAYIDSSGKPVVEIYKN